MIQENEAIRERSYHSRHQGKYKILTERDDADRRRCAPNISQVGYGTRPRTRRTLTRNLTLGVNLTDAVPFYRMDTA